MGCVSRQLLVVFGGMCRGDIASVIGQVDSEQLPLLFLPAASAGSGHAWALRLPKA